MAAATLRSAAPAVYAHLLSSFFDEPMIVESRATCDACPMCNKSDDPVEGSVTFAPSVRCCTYYPPLPNFLVGALLADASEGMEEGRRRVRERIASGLSATPHWVKAPPAVAALHASKIGDGFGRDQELLCPYYRDSSCTIWRYRDAVCSTYFCRHVGGARGREFWSALRDYLLRVEVRLAAWAARSVDAAVGESDGRFGSWAGREDDFYIQCFEALGQLDRDGFARAVDESPRARLLLDRVRARYGELTRPQPATHLVLNRRLKRSPAPGGVMVAGDSPWDPVFLSEALVRVLLTLMPTEAFTDALHRMKREQGVDLPAPLVEQLRAFEVLVSPEPPQT